MVFTDDNRDRVTQIADPISALANFTYDENLQTVTDARQSDFVHLHQPNRSTRSKNGLNVLESYGYNANGNLTVTLTAA
jgi:hypothetical protein